jgi:putative transposase
MGRATRVTRGERVSHVLKRANGRQTIFPQAADDAAFEQVLGEANQRLALRLLAYCVRPHHWHRVLWPSAAGDLSRWVGWVTHTHPQRWPAQQQMTGTGHLSQGRCTSFPVQTEAHFLPVCRSVERHPVRAGLVSQADHWRWGSLWQRVQGDGDTLGMLSAWPVDPPDAWVQWVNTPLPAEEWQGEKVSGTLAG